MRHTIWVITFFLVTALAVGCKSTAEKAAVKPKASEESAATQLKKAQAATREAAQDYGYARKAEYIAEMKKVLADLQEELDRLSAKVDRSSGAAKGEAKTQLEAVRERWVLAKNQLDQAEGASESTWDEVKGGFQKVYGELKDSFEKTRQWLGDKIEP